MTSVSRSQFSFIRHGTLQPHQPSVGIATWSAAGAEAPSRDRRQALPRLQVFCEVEPEATKTRSETHVRVRRIAALGVAAGGLAARAKLFGSKRS